MKKKLFWSVLTIMMVALTSVGFVSCGSDDDGGPSGGRDAALVGSWRSERSGWTAGWDFKADGKCYYGEWSNGQTEKLADFPGTWATSGNTLNITWTDEEGTDIDSYTYSLSEGNKKLMLTNKKGVQQVFLKK